MRTNMYTSIVSTTINTYSKGHALHPIQSLFQWQHGQETLGFVSIDSSIYELTSLEL